jgi:hypothetical protein
VDSEVLWSCQYYLRAALAVTYALDGAYSDVILAAVEPVWYPIDDCRRKKLFIGVCVELVALKEQQIIFWSAKITFILVTWSSSVCLFLHFPFRAL